jgi:hypothetical protein
MIPDYKIRLPSDLIDFEEDVHGGSLDGQQINDFPQPGQARWDWMRMVILGLLANQSSEDEPINYKIGTIWMNLNDNFYKYFDGENFEEIARAVRMGEMNLEDWGEAVEDTVGKVTEAATFSGTIETTGVTEVDIPSDALAAAAYPNNHPVLYLNQFLIDPRLTAFNINRNTVLLLDNEYGSIDTRKDDVFTIMIQRLDEVVPETVIVA